MHDHREETSGMLAMGPANPLNPMPGNETNDADPCFWTPQGQVCRNPRTGIECFHPHRGRPICYRYR